VDEQRHDHEHRVDIFPRQQIAVVFVRLRIAADGLDAMVEGFLPDVAQRHAAATRDVLQMLQQVGAAAARNQSCRTAPGWLAAMAFWMKGAPATAVTAPAAFNTSRRETSFSCAINASVPFFRRGYSSGDDGCGPGWRAILHGAAPLEHAVGVGVKAILLLHVGDLGAYHVDFVQIVLTKAGLVA